MQNIRGQCHEYQDIFGKYSKKYDAVLHINISNFFSSCYQNACLAAQDFPNVYVVDSFNLSTEADTLCWMRQRWRKRRYD
jgi:fatty acid-binding protein DegV